MIISVIRCYPNENSTGGVLLIDGEKFCETQEDTARADGYKILRQTAIPAGSYNVFIRHSYGFKRKVLCLRNGTNDGVPVVRNGGIEFSYIYFHGGNTADNSEGCILVANNRIDRNTIQGTAEISLFQLVQSRLENGKDVTVEVINDCANIYGYAESKYA